jgi:hypothetical protein
MTRPLGELGLLDSRQHGASAPAPTVLIVGSGPAGLFAACELARHGVKPRIVERRFAPHHETRGTALQPAVLEIIDRAGLIEPFLRAGVRIRQVQVLGPGLQEIAAANFAGIGCKYEFQCSLPQWRTEAILHEHLARLGIKIEFGTEVKSIEDDPAGLRVMLDADGRPEVFTASYLLGAGGAHSVTRHSMQEHLDGETYDGRFIVADVKTRLPCPPECGRVFVGPDGFVLLSPLPDDRWLIFVIATRPISGPSFRRRTNWTHCLVPGSASMLACAICYGFPISKCTGAPLSAYAMGVVFCWAMPVTCPVRSAGKGSMPRSWTRPILPGSLPWW